VVIRSWNDTGDQITSAKKAIIVRAGLVRLVAGLILFSGGSSFIVVE
jgi:hypothetical protein